MLNWFGALANVQRTSTPTASPSAQRLVYLDVFRGLAVFFMFDAHVTDAVVHLGSSARPIHHWHNVTFNLPAPGFLFAAGLSFGMVAFARWEQFPGWTDAVRSRLARLAEVLFVAYLLHVPTTALSRTLTSPETALRRLFGWDILQCIGYTSLLLLAVAVCVPRREWFLRACVALTLLIALASAWLNNIPWAATPDLPWWPQSWPMPWWIATIFTKQLGSNFPFFPYAGFLTAGAIWGYLFAQSRQRGGEHGFLKSTLLTGGALLAACLLLAQVSLPAPYDDFWGGSPVFFFLRVGLLMAILAALHFLESWLLPALGFIVMLGKESLLVYFVHLIIVYGSPVNRVWNLRHLAGDGVGFWTWLALLAAITVSMTALAWVWTRAKQRLGARLDRALWAGAALATIFFILR
ncbi:MAG: DUF1624 domain-containing protein [Acidobacteria bacterium]|nr:DUF1624 domain-containing protein [Acidobacteriota bacterium]